MMNKLSPERFSPRSWSWDTILRLILLAGSGLLALILANAAASLLEVWRLQPGALVPAPWDGLLGSSLVTDRVHRLSLLGTALLAGASLACLVFFVERVVSLSWRWLRDQLGR